jgi:hypothetical protein
MQDLRTNIPPPSSGSDKPSKKLASKQVASNSACSSETSVDFQRTTELYIPEDSVSFLLLNTRYTVLAEVEDCGSFYYVLTSHNL